MAASLRCDALESYCNRLQPRGNAKPEKPDDPLVVEVFDGDTSGTWDKPGGAVTTYQLFTDANRDGTDMQLLAQKTDAQMGDNVWTELFNGAHAPVAAAP